MKFKIKGGVMMRDIVYRDYIANNLSEYGCALFCDEYEDFNFDEFYNYLKSKANFAGNIDKVPLNVYDMGDKKIHTYYAFVNESKVPTFAFFDAVRNACMHFRLKRFYACDFATDQIFEMTLTSINEYGRLKDFKKLLNINSSRTLCVRTLKWCAPIGWIKYLSEARVFRNDADKEYYTRYGKLFKETVDVFYTMEECASYGNTTGNELNFTRDTILEFDIDNPTLTINAKRLKARNLNIKALVADEFFCGHLKCEAVKAQNIYAESIKCKELKSEQIKTNFEYGVSLKCW